VLHGTQGSYQKARTDNQEAQLLQGISPLAPGYGHENPGQEGRLTLASVDGTLVTSADFATPGNYLGLFDAVFQTIRHNAPYPISPDELCWQNALLEQPADA
jgi:hypothetical protein